MGMQDFITAYIASSNPVLYKQRMIENELARQLQAAKDLAIRMTDPLFGSNPTGSNSRIVKTFNAAKSNLKQPKSGQYSDAISKASQMYGVPEDLIAQIIQNESSGNPNAVSPTGAQGLMQLFPAAAKDAGYEGADLTDPTTNILAGTSYFKQMQDKFGPLAPLAYHDGPTAVAQGRQPTPEGLAYLQKFANMQPEMQVQNEQPMQDVQEQQIGGSKFLPNSVTGGEGILGNDMDPSRRAWTEMLKNAFQSGDPQLMEFALKGLSDMQNSTMRDIERTPLLRNIADTNLVPGSQEYSDAVLNAIKKGSGININLNDNKPLTVEEATSLTDASGNKVRVPAGADHGWLQNSPIPLYWAKPPSSEEAAKRAQTQTAIQMANELTELLDSGANIDSFWGKLQQMRSGEDLPNVLATKILDSAKIGNDPKDVKAFALTESLSNQVLQAFRGAAVGPMEQERFNRQLPRPGMPKDLLRQNLELTLKNLQYLELRREAISRGQPVPELPSWVKEQKTTAPVDTAPEGFSWDSDETQ